MEKFRWGNMNKPGVFIDNYNVNSYSYLRTRLNFARLAEQLYTEGRKDSSIRALNRCLELMPANIYVHDVYSIDLIEAAYKIEAMKQSHQLVNEYANQCLEEIRFYNAMPLWQFKITQTENYVAQQTVQQLADIAGKYEDTKTKNLLEKQLKEALKQ
jgi:hypothetical protein